MHRPARRTDRRAEGATVADLRQQHQDRQQKTAGGIPESVSAEWGMTYYSFWDFLYYIGTGK